MVVALFCMVVRTLDAHTQHATVITKQQWLEKLDEPLACLPNCYAVATRTPQEIKPLPKVIEATATVQSEAQQVEAMKKMIVQLQWILQVMRSLQ